jgi:beta-glucosidase
LLLTKLQKLGTPLVLVLLGGRVLDLSRIIDQVGAVIESWIPGEDGGTAVAEVLFGEFNPGGKLPITFPRSSGQIPIYYSHKPSGGQSHWYKDYTQLSSKPLFPFGFGLSYTSFTYSNLTLSASSINKNGSIVVKAEVANSGSMDADEVVQMYIRDRVGSITRPIKELKGFKRIHLKKGEMNKIH